MWRKLHVDAVTPLTPPPAGVTGRLWQPSAATGSEGLRPPAASVTVSHRNFTADEADFAVRLSPMFAYHASAR
jgi:hypothetical protein